MAVIDLSKAVLSPQGTWLYWRHWLGHDLGQTLQWAVQQPLQPGSIAGEGVKDESRRSQVSFPLIQSAPWVDKSLKKLTQIGSALLDVDVNPGEPTGIQVTHYQPGDYYHWHVDVDPSRHHIPEERKLSITICLAGPPTIELEKIDTPPMQPGDALVFPSTLKHQVAPNEEPRWSLVAWSIGPRWR